MEKLILKSHDDLDLALYKFGTRKKFNEPLIFTTPGWGVSAEEYFHTLDFLFDDYEIYFLETRGTGHSQAAHRQEDYTFSHFSDDFEAIRKQLNLEKLNLIGHSFGGPLAMEFVLKYPSSINKLILLSTFSLCDDEYNKRKEIIIEGRRNEPWFEEAQRYRFDDTKTNSQEDLERVIMGTLPFYFTDQQKLKESLPLFLKGSVNIHPYLGTAQLHPLNIKGKISKINCETHIICGEDDFVCSKVDNLIVHEEIKGSSFKVIEGVGHFPWIEKPEVFKSAFDSIF